MADDIDGPRVSVVIPVRNGTATMGAELAALACQRAAPPFEIVVSDNGSTDGLQEWLVASSAQWPQLDIRCVDSSAKPGVSYARNEGVRHARADIILICDSDDIVCPTWVRSMAEALETYDGVGGSLDELTLNPPSSPMLAFATSSLPVGLGFLPYAVGANCGVRRKVWQALEGFDEAYLHGGEEIDFFWRLQLGGYKFGFVPQAVIAYRHRTGIRQNIRTAFWRGIGTCQLAARFSTQIPSQSAPAIARTWGGLFLRSPLLLQSNRRLGYLRRLAHHVGLIAGSLRYGIIHLA
jgi:GT2 family glycosyltransferase